MIRRVALVRMGLMAMVAAMAWWIQSPAQTRASAATVRLEPPSQSVPVDGGEFSVDIVVEDAVGVGAFEFRLSFDPGIIRYVGVERGPFMDGAGAQVSCVVYVPPERDSVQYGCGTLGTVGTAIPGASGSGVLARVRFAPVSVGTTNLLFTRLTLVRPEVCVETCSDEDDLPVTAFDGAVRVYDPASGDSSAPPTPKPDARRLTPTAIPAVTGTPYLSLGSGGSARGAGSENAVDRAGTVNTPTSGTSAGRTAAGREANEAFGDLPVPPARRQSGEEFPVAGYGAQHRVQGGLPRGVVLGLAAAGILLVSASTFSRRVEPVRPRT